MTFSHMSRNLLLSIAVLPLLAVGVTQAQAQELPELELDGLLRTGLRIESSRYDGVSGFEINTDRYTKGEPGQIELIRQVATDGAAAGLRVYAGHGLTTENVGAISAVPEIEELNIGHALIGRAVLVGMEAAVREMLAAMSA